MPRRAFTPEELATRQQERSVRRIQAERHAQRSEELSQRHQQAIVQSRLTTDELAAREQAHERFRVSTQARLQSNAGMANARGAIVNAPVQAVQSGSSSHGSTILMVLLIMGGLILVYDLVTHPQPTGTFLGSVSNWLATISTNSPLFTKTATTSTQGSTTQ